MQPPFSRLLNIAMWINNMKIANRIFFERISRAEFFRYLGLFRDGAVKTLVVTGIFSAACLAMPLAAQPLGSAGAEEAVTLRSGGKCLDVNERQVHTNGGRVQLWDCDGRPSQSWRFERGRILNLASNRCLDVHRPDTGANGARVQVYDCNGGTNQAWRFDQGLLVVQADNRCLDVLDSEAGRNGALVQSWDCRASGNQRWRVDTVSQFQGPRDQFARDPITRDVEAGPLWNNGDADRKCPAVCAPGRWTGQWRTTVPGRMSVCGCTNDGGRWQGGSVPEYSQSQGAGVRPMFDGRFEELLQVVRAEAFGQGKLRILEGAARDNYFVIAQVRRVIETFSFPSDKMRALEIMAPRVLDRQNAFSLYSAFDFEMEKEQARVIFDRLK